MRMQSPSGRPAFTPRTMTSTALANSFRNARSLRVRSVFSIQRGNPSVKMNALASVTRMGAPAMKLPAVAIAPHMTEMIQNVFTDHFRPALLRFVFRSRFFCLRLRFSISLMVSSTWRLRLTPSRSREAAATDPGVRVLIRCTRLAALAEPSRRGSRKTHATPPMQAMAKKMTAIWTSVSDGTDQTPALSSCTAAASSAAARLRSSL